MTILVAALSTTFTAPVTVTPAKIVEGLRPIAYAAAPIGTRFAASMEDGSVRIIDSKTRQTVRQLEKHPQPAYAVAWSADGTMIATGDESARIWIHLADSGKKVREFRTHTRGIQKLSFNLGKTHLISTGKDDQIHIYNLASTSPKEERAVLGKGDNFYGATFHSKLPSLFVTGFLGTGGGKAYDTKSGNIAGFLTAHDGQGIFDIAWNPAGTRVVSGGRDSTAAVFAYPGYKRIASLRGHGDWVNNVVFSPNGKLIATASTDATVKVWDATNYQRIADLKNQSFVGSPLCFTADGKNLVTVSDQGFLQFNNVAPPQAAALPKAPAVKNVKKKKGRG